VRGGQRKRRNLQHPLSRTGAFSAPHAQSCPPLCCDTKNANRNVRGFRWEIAHAAVSRRPPISLNTTVARTEGYTTDAEVWDLSIVQGPFSVASCQTLALRFAALM
jgi:hypothetical protein